MIHSEPTALETTTIILQQFTLFIEQFRDGDKCRGRRTKHSAGWLGSCESLQGSACGRRDTSRARLDAQPSEFFGNLLDALLVFLVQSFDFIHPCLERNDVVCVLSMTFHCQISIHTGLNGVEDEIIVHERVCSCQEVVLPHDV